MLGLRWVVVPGCRMAGKGRVRGAEAVDVKEGRVSFHFELVSDIKIYLIIRFSITGDIKSMRVTH